MAFYPLMIELGGAPCLIAGGGRIALHKAGVLAAQGADVTVVDPSGMLPDGPYDRFTDDLDDFVITLFMDVLTLNNEYKDAGLDASVLEA